MYFKAYLTFLTFIASSAAATTSTTFTANVTYDNTYDNPAGSLSNVACSNGANGLLTKGFTTFDSLPSFPYIGGAQGVVWNSPNCGSCWSLTFNGKTIKVLAIDAAGAGFNIAQKALDELTDGQAVAKGKFSVLAQQVSPSECGLY